MSNGFEVAPEEVARVARDTLDGAQRLGEMRLNAQHSLLLPPDVFGQLPDAGRLHSTQQAAAEQLDAALDELALIYEDDADSLYQAALNYVRVDTTTTTTSGPKRP